VEGPFFIDSFANSQLAAGLDSVTGRKTGGVHQCKYRFAGLSSFVKHEHEEKSMKRMKMLVAALLAAMVVTAGTAFAGTLDDIAKRGKLRVGMEPGYMPFELTNQKGEIIGFDVDVARRMAKAMGVELELVSTAWDGIIPALLTDKFDIIMSGMTLTQERNMSINFASPYIEIGQSVILNNKVAGAVKSYADLNDAKYTVASKLGTTGEQAVKRLIPNAKYVSFETEQEGTLEVVNGKIDAFVYDLPYNAVAVSQRGEGKVTHLDKPFTFEPLAWGIRKGDPDFLNWLNNFMHQIKNDGTYDKIYQKWFQDDAWLKEIQ
jgi:polar amino acid transport system substrate-binding protein